MANTTTPPILPTDAKRIALMLAARGIQDADERVLHQLLDFAHRYTSDILEDAQAYADHANRPGKVETSDVELAVQARSGWEFTEAAPKDVSSLPPFSSASRHQEPTDDLASFVALRCAQYLLPIARELNRIPLPTLNAAYSHITLPEPHLMLGQPNFRLVPRMPAPESLGLFRVGGEEEESGSEVDESDDDDDEESRDASQRDQEGGEGRADAMETDKEVPLAGEGGVPVQGDAAPAVNGVKRPLEEDDDYDAD